MKRIFESIWRACKGYVMRLIHHKASKRDCIVAVISMALVIIIVVSSIINANTITTETIYRETEAGFGPLTVGVTKEGSISVGTTTQTFDLDTSEFDFETQTFSWEGGAGMSQGAMGGAMMNNFTITALSDSSRELVVENVCVSTGSIVNVGDPLVNFTKESIDGIRNELLNDVTDATLNLEQVKTDQNVTTLQAKQELDTNTLYGKYALVEYTEQINKLKDDVDTASENLLNAQDDINELKEDLETLQSEYQSAQKAYEGTKYAVENADKMGSIYNYINDENMREESYAALETLGKNMEDTTEQIASLAYSISTLEYKLSEAKKALAVGEIKAKAAYDKRILYYNNANELYEVETTLLSDELAKATEEYNEAALKLKDFDDYIVNQTVYAEYSGVVTGVSIEKGDSVGTSEELITLNDYSDVTVDVTVDEDDMETIHIGDTVKLTLTAFEDEQFTGIVSEISDAVTNSTTGAITYTVTVEITQGTERMYEGMTSNVTFITKESDEVVYVSNRAIIRDNGKSYVKVKDNEGRTKIKEVTTGFSDGTNVEVVEGLEAGEMVLIESKVNE